MKVFSIVILVFAFSATALSTHHRSYASNGKHPLLEPSRIKNRKLPPYLHLNVSNIENFIIGGNDTSLGEIPYIVGITDWGVTYCGGAIYNKRTIITAAHCAYQ